MQAVKMPLMPQIFRRRQLYVYTLGLEHDTDMTAQFVRIFRGVISENDGTSADWNHQRRKNAKHRGLAAAVRPEQSKQLGMTNVKRNAVQSSVIAIAVHEVLNGNRCGRI